MLEKTDSATKNGKSRDTGKIGSKTQNEDKKKNKKQKTKTKQNKKSQHRKLKR